MESERHLFKARLGDLDDCARERWKVWAQRACLRSYLIEQDGEVFIFAERHGSTDVKSLQKLLRTLSSHWKTLLPKFVKEEWLWLITAQEFDAAQQPQMPPTVDSKLIKTNAPPSPTAHDDEHVQILYCLSPQFAEQSHRMLEALRAAKHAPWRTTDPSI